MKKFDLGQTISVLANIGVIVGIVFLAIEVNQNNNLLEAEARRAVLDRRTSSAELVAGNHQLATILAKAASGEALTEGESVQMDAFNRRLLVSFEWQFGEYQRGALELAPEMLNGWRAAYYSKDRGLQQTWAYWRNQTVPGFAEFFERNVVDQPPE